MAEDGLGSFDGGLQDPEMEETTPPEAPQLVPVKEQPCNQATMMCLRGPCVHLWRLTLRFDSAVKDVMSERSWTCLANSSEEFDLNDRLIYFCDRWWPRAGLRDDNGKLLVKISDVGRRKLGVGRRRRRRSVLRPALHRAWEQGLQHLGYDFSWRDFDPEVNVDDGAHQRKFNAPGGIVAAREALEALVDDGLPPATSIPEEDDE